MKCKKKHHISICEEKQENSTQNTPSQGKENRNSNFSQSPSNIIAKNTANIGDTHFFHPANHIFMQSSVTKAYPKFSILMQKDKYLSAVIVQSMRKKAMHGGVSKTLTQSRKTYWIPQSRQLVKRINPKCAICRKIQGPPILPVPKPPLQKSRFLQSQAFHHACRHRLRRFSLCAQFYEIL